MKNAWPALLLLVLLLLLGTGGGLLLLGPGTGPGAHPDAPTPSPEPAQDGSAARGDTPADGDGGAGATPAGASGPGPAREGPESGSTAAGGMATGASPGASQDGASPAADDPEPAELPPGCHTPLTGTVVDLDTGKPIPGARILYGPLPNWWGADAGENGKFRFELSPEQLAQGEMFRLRVSAPGYETDDAVPQAGVVRIGLLRQAGSHRYGRIRGRAEDRDGRPLPGVLLVVVGDEESSRHYLRIFADERGDFVLEGIEPGHLELRLEGGRTENVYLPEGGVTEVVLRSGFTASADSERHGLSRGPVRFTGLSGAEGALVVAEYHGFSSIERWRAVVRDGEAAFPALFPGEWHLELRSAGDSREVVVEVPEDARSVPFPPEKK